MKRLTAFLAILALLFCVFSFASADGDAWTCPGCGREGNTGNFCPSCGKPRPQVIVCPGCGTEYAADTDFAFCPNCGTSLKANETVSEAPTIETPLPEAPATEEPTPEAPSSKAPITEAPATGAPATETPATEEPTPEGPSIKAPTQEAPVTEEPVPEQSPTPESPARRDLVQVSDGTYLLDQVLTHESFSEIWLTDADVTDDVRSGKQATYDYLAFSPAPDAYISEISDHAWKTHDPVHKIQVHYNLLKDGKFDHWFKDCRDMGNVNGSQRYMDVSEHEVYLVFMLEEYVNPQYRLVVKIIPELSKDTPVEEVTNALNAAADAENERILATARKETRGPLWTNEFFLGVDMLCLDFFDNVRTRFDFSPISMEALRPGLETSGFTMLKLSYQGVEGFYVLNKGYSLQVNLYHAERENFLPSMKKGKTGASFNYTTAAGNTYECFAEDHKDGGYKYIYLCRVVDQTKSGTKHMEIWIIAPFETNIQSQEAVQALIEELDGHITVTLQ